MTPPSAAAAVAAPATRPARPARPGRSTAPRGPARARPGTQRRPSRVSAPSRRAARVQAPVAGRLQALDRLIRSRMWIGVVAFALIGIVAMQLWLLKLNTGIGRAIEHEALLQRTNAALSAEGSAMSAGDLVESEASADGMTIVPAGALRFLHVHGPLDERLAAARLAQPVSAHTALGAGSTSATATTAPVEAAGQTATQGASQTVGASEANGQTATQSASPPTATTETVPTATTEPAPTAPQPEAQAQGG